MNRSNGDTVEKRNPHQRVTAEPHARVSFRDGKKYVNYASEHPRTFDQTPKGFTTRTRIVGQRTVNPDGNRTVVKLASIRDND